MCATLGHSHPAIVKAIQSGAEDAIHLFSGMIPESVARLAKKLSEWLPKPLTRSMFVNTGSESNEAALRMAKMVTGGYEVIALGGSWHGVTGQAAAMSFASGRRGYGPKVPGVFVIPEPYAYRCPIKHCRDMLERHIDIGRPPRQMAADGGYASGGNLKAAKEKGVRDMAKIEDMVRSRWVYRKLRNFRAGIEAGISCLKPMAWRAALRI